MKKVFATLLSLVMATGLAACTGGPATTTAAGTAAGTTASTTAAGTTASTTAAGTTASTTAAGTTASTTAAGTTASTTTAGTTTAGTTGQLPSNLKIGFIALHDTNSGYDAAHIEGVTNAAKELGIDVDSQIIFKYNIPEDETAYDTAVDLAEQGATIIFSNSYGHQMHMQAAAEEYPEITFVAATGDMAAPSGLKNLKNIFPNTFESRYVSGVVAGMKLKELMDAGTATDPYVGYIGAFPYAEVVSGYTAFLLGIQSIVPEAHMDVQYTNSWYDPVAEGEAANALMARGAVIIGQHADSTGAPSAAQAALTSGKTAYSVGYNIDMRSVAPDAALTSAQNNWSVLYKATLEKFVNGQEVPVDFAAGAAQDAVMISELGAKVAPGTKEAVDAAWAGIKDGSLKIFDTSKFTVKTDYDKTVAAGKTPSYEIDDAGHVTKVFALDSNGDFVNDTGEAIVDGAFAESTLRSAPYFSLRIDGITELNNN